MRFADAKETVCALLKQVAYADIAKWIKTKAKSWLNERFVYLQPMR